MLTELSTFLSLLRDIAPLVHCITNRVTMNDCANILLAAGARPIMADDPDECAEITSISRGLCINIGTLDKAKIPGMLASGRAANRLGLPILLDPVGVGASRLRTETALKIISELSLSAIRMNRSELMSLAASLDEAGATADNTTARENPERECEVRCGGVDSVGDTDDIDKVTGVSLRLSRKVGAVVIVTGAVDVVADAACGRVLLIRNGDSRMRKVTGCGCMLSAICTAFLAAANDEVRFSANEPAEPAANESMKSVSNVPARFASNKSVKFAANESAKSVSNEPVKFAVNESAKSVSNEPVKFAANESAKSVANELAKSAENESAKSVANELAKSVVNEPANSVSHPAEKSTARLYAAAAAVTAMGISGELAASRMGELDGSASLRTYLIDAIYNLSVEQLERFARVSEYIRGDIAVTQNNEVTQ